MEQLIQTLPNHLHTHPTTYSVTPKSQHGRPPIKISAHRPTMLTEVLCGSPPAPTAKYQEHQKVKLFLCFDLATRHAGVWGQWMYSSRHSWSRHCMKISGQLHAPAALPQWESSWYPLVKRVGGTQSWSRHGDKEKNPQPLPRIEPLSSSS